MKNLKNYIFEKFKISKDIKNIHYLEPDSPCLCVGIIHNHLIFYAPFKFISFNEDTIEYKTNVYNSSESKDVKLSGVKINKHGYYEYCRIHQNGAVYLPIEIYKTIFTDIFKDFDKDEHYPKYELCEKEDVNIDKLIKDYFSFLSIDDLNIDIRQSYYELVELYKECEKAYESYTTK